MLRFILASSSPNRRALLDRMGFGFEAIAPDYEEIPLEKEGTVEMVERFAIGKAKAVYERVKNKKIKDKKAPPEKGDASQSEAGGSSDFLILGCDSMISLEGRSIGKAKDQKEAMEQLLFFRGKRQEVITGLALIGCINGQYIQKVEHEITPLDFRADIDKNLIEKYLAFDDWKGKCGSYSILGTGVFFLENMGGDFQNIVGLPILRLGRMIESMTGHHPLEILKPKKCKQ